MELTRTECGRRVFVSVDIEEMLSLFHADDISSFTDTVNGLQRLINTLKRFCDAVGMRTNASKTKIIVFRNVTMKGGITVTFSLKLSNSIDILVYF